MSAFILTWNPDGPGWPDDLYEAQVAGTIAPSDLTDQWSVGVRKSGIEPGDHAYLFRQRHERGITASGTFTSRIFEGSHWDGSGRTTPYAAVQWNRLLYPEDGLSTEVLKRTIPQIPWDRLQGSGVRVPDDAVDALESLWLAHAAGINALEPGDFPVGTYSEGDVTRVEVSRYERDPAARAACIARHGTSCVACGFNFGATYGPLGEGFIHVHHLRELSTLGPGYKIDPVTEMRPLCPNCHAMAHQYSPPLTPDGIREEIAEARRGHTPQAAPDRLAP